MCPVKPDLHPDIPITVRHEYTHNVAPVTYIRQKT